MELQTKIESNRAKKHILEFDAYDHVLENKHHCLIVQREELQFGLNPAKRFSL